MLCATLSKTLLNYVTFDPSNEDHIKAFLMLYINGRQHPTLRFHLTDNFNSVPEMMLSKVIQYQFRDLINNLDSDHESSRIELHNRINDPKIDKVSVEFNKLISKFKSHKLDSIPVTIIPSNQTLN